MRTAIVDVLKGVVTGLAGALTLGAATNAVLAVHGWPEGEQPTDRARHLAEAIAGGMFVAVVASFILVPGLTFVFLRRSRRRQ